MNISSVTDASSPQSQPAATKTNLNFKNILAHITSTNISTESKKDSLQSIYDDWQNNFLSLGIGSDRREHVIDSAKAFSNIMVKAADTGGYTNPQAFVSNLTAKELTAIQHTQGLAQSINPTALSHEGALNLLLPPSYSQDIDNDGFMETGISRGWTFPPRNAPMAVHEAWAESMEGLSQKEQFLASGKFLGVSIGANIKPDGSGFYEPQDPEFKNPFAAANFSYSSLVEKMLASLETFKAQTPEQQYENDKALFSKLLTAFSKHQVS